MKHKFIASRELVDQLDIYEYDEMLKLAAVLKMLEEDGLTAEMIQKWGTHFKGRSYLQITLCKKKREEIKDGYIPNFKTSQVLIEIPEF